MEEDGFEPSKAELTDLQSAPEEDGFEPSKAELTDLQSAPFGHLGTPP